MLTWLSARGISPPLGIAIIVLGVIQLTLQIWAFVDLIRRPAPTQRKVVFGLVIVLVGLVGAIAYLAVGRSMLDEQARASAPSRCWRWPDCLACGRRCEDSRVA